LHCDCAHRTTEESIAEACRRFGVGRLEVFGSAARGDFDSQKSDLDFIANFLPPLHPGVADRFLGLADALEKIFARPVDLLTERNDSQSGLARGSHPRPHPRL